MAGNGEKKPWDGMNEKLDGASKSARDAASDSMNQAKSLVNGNVNQIKDLFGANVEQAKELTSSARLAIRRVGVQVLDGVKIAVSPVVQVFKKADSADGTVLRKQISSAREQLNEQLKDAQVKLKETQKATDEQLVPVRAMLADAQTQLLKANEFRRTHPEAAVAGLVAVVGLPSLLLRGKFIATRNVLVAVGGGAALAYGADRLAVKKN